MFVGEKFDSLETKELPYLDLLRLATRVKNEIGNSYLSKHQNDEISKSIQNLKMWDIGNNKLWPTYGSLWEWLLPKLPRVPPKSNHARFSRVWGGKYGRRTCDNLWKSIKIDIWTALLPSKPNAEPMVHWALPLGSARKKEMALCLTSPIMDYWSHHISISKRRKFVVVHHVYGRSASCIRTSWLFLQVKFIVVKFYNITDTPLRFKLIC